MENVIICHCKQVSYTDIERALEKHSKMENTYMSISAGFSYRGNKYDLTALEYNYNTSNEKNSYREVEINYGNETYKFQNTGKMNDGTIDVFTFYSYKDVYRFGGNKGDEIYDLSKFSLNLDQPTITNHLKLIYLQFSY